MRRARRRLLSIPLLVAGVIGIIAQPASASATSFFQYELTTGPYYPSWYADNCIEAQINDVADNVALIRSSYTGSGCGGGYANMQSGWLGANAYGYRDGGYCGSTGYIYSSSATGLFGVGGVMCSNPAGSQAFRTTAFGAVWNNIYGTWQYSYVTGPSSPIQNY